MPRNGAGTYNPPPSTWNPGVNGVTATTADYNAQLIDLSAAITQSVSSDGQTPMTGNLPMGNNKITGLANGSAVTDAAAFGQIGRYAGNCRLTKSGANLLLIPFNGNQLTINGVLQTVPSAGVTLTPTGTPATLYYIYAFMTGTTMTLENSTTAHATDVVTGIEIKSGDPTRTLVGMAQPIAGPAWSDLVTQRFVVSWFNRRPLLLSSALSVATGSFHTGTYSEISVSLRLEVLSWTGDAVRTQFQGRLVANVINMTSSTAIALDSTVGDSFSSTQAYSSTAIQPVACALDVSPAEGYHLISPFAQQDIVGTATYSGGVAGLRCVHSGTVLG